MEENDECPICMDHLSDPLLKTDCCKQLIHSLCLAKSLDITNGKCPFCRKQIRDINNCIRENLQDPNLFHGALVITDDIESSIFQQIMQNEINTFEEHNFRNTFNEVMLERIISITTILRKYPLQ